MTARRPVLARERLEQYGAAGASIRVALGDGEVSVTIKRLMRLWDVDAGLHGDDAIVAVVHERLTDGAGIDQRALQGPVAVIAPP